MRVIWLSAETPDRHGGGGQRRQFHQLRALLQAGAEVHVATLTSPQDDASVRALAPVERFGPLRRRGQLIDPTLAAMLARENFDAAVVAHIESVVHVQHALAHQRLPWLLDLHNVNSRWHRARGEALAAALWRRRERIALRQASMATVCSREEQHALGAVAPRARIEVAGHGIDADEWPVAALAAARGAEVAFFGAWGHGPNTAGVRWLVDRVWPTVRAVVPRARLLLAGPGDPPPTALACAGVAHLGRVEDLAGLLGHVRVVAVPILDGIGARVKFGEALASGAAVVSTSAGAEGFDADGAFARADDAAAFARACVEMLTNAKRAHELGRAGRALAFERFMWPQTSEAIIRFAQAEARR